MIVLPCISRKSLPDCLSPQVFSGHTHASCLPCLDNHFSHSSCHCNWPLVVHCMHCIAIVTISHVEPSKVFKTAMLLFSTSDPLKLEHELKRLKPKSKYHFSTWCIFSLDKAIVSEINSVEFIVDICDLFEWMSVCWSAEKMYTIRRLRIFLFLYCIKVKGWPLV